MYNIFLDFRSRSVCKECNTTRMLCGEYVLVKGTVGGMKRHRCNSSLVDERLQVKYPALLCLGKNAPSHITPSQIREELLCRL